MSEEETNPLRAYELALVRMSATMDAVFDATSEAVTCQKRCSACCFEPVYASEPEVLLIIQAVERGDTPFTMDELRARVEAWVRAFEGSELHKVDPVSAHDYRAAHIRCPLLHGRKDYRSVCGVYDDRPAGCRMHYSKGERVGCEDLEKRKDQQFVDVGGTATYIQPIMDALLELGYAAREAMDGKEVVTDHLGVMLARALDIPCPKSAARRADHIPPRPPRLT